ncbi:hypothetical protein A2U01_0023086, partial [Trifolium medium]|nr:hypothetical protein [Trifolium medium]
IAAIQQGEPSNLHDVEIIPEPLNTQHSSQAPQFATQAFIPASNIFSSIHASLSPNHNHQTPPLDNPQPQNTAGNHKSNKRTTCSQPCLLSYGSKQPDSHT